jgi:hypothetical protein
MPSRRMMARGHNNLPFKPNSTSPPSLCHTIPLGFALRIVGNFGHIFALSGVRQKFVSGIYWQISHISELSIFFAFFLKGRLGGLHATDAETELLHVLAELSAN